LDFHCNSPRINFYLFIYFLFWVFLKISHRRTRWVKRPWIKSRASNTRTHLQFQRIDKPITNALKQQSCLRVNLAIPRVHPLFQGG